MIQVKDNSALNGIMVINKPSGITSHDVVDCLRRRLNVRRVGHSGTLDPLATGVLVMLVGRATKLFNQFVAYDKGYRAKILLGKKTDTADIQGEVLEEKPADFVTKEKVEEVLSQFLGETEQIPPMYSAIKHKGKKLYELARKGVVVDRAPRKIRIDVLKLLEFEPPEFKIYVECSKGTYVRKLAEDIGEKLGTAACIAKIERTKVGPFHIDEAVSLEDAGSGDLRRWQGNGDLWKSCADSPS